MRDSATEGQTMQGVTVGVKACKLNDGGCVRMCNNVSESVTGRKRLSMSVTEYHFARDLVESCQKIPEDIRGSSRASVSHRVSEGVPECVAERRRL